MTSYETIARDLEEKGYKKGRFLDLGTGYESGFGQRVKQLASDLGVNSLDTDGFLILGYKEGKVDKGKPGILIDLLILDENIKKDGRLVRMGFNVEGFNEYVNGDSFKFNDDKIPEIMEKYKDYLQ